MRPIALALLVAVSATQLHAQAAATRPVQLVVSGGLQVPTGTFADYHDMGVHADVAVVLNLGGFRFRPELSYSRFNLKDFDLSQLTSRRTTGEGAVGGARVDAASDALSTMLGGFANLELPLGKGALQPFVLAGVGAVNVTSDATAGAIRVTDLKASLNVGAGIRVRLGPITGLIEARLNNVPAGDTRAYFRDVRTIPVTFGFVF